ncbi:MAG TPA: acyl carrier protein [Cyanothece sp. UBA12306]|nr:acyl carrier protein [Cyanothece sp. UBA12306]
MTVENLTKTPSKAVIKEWLIDLMAEQFQMEPEEIDSDQQLTRYGLDSVDGFTLVGELEEWFEEEFCELEIPNTLIWDYPTINKITEYLASQLEEFEQN